MHVAITGASSGIGEALVHEFTRRGADVTLVARRRALLDALAQKASNVRTHVVEADLADPAKALDWLDGAEAALGPIDVLVNNAGIQIVQAADETPWDAAERLLALDLSTPLRLTAEMVRRMSARGGGTIVNMSSMAGIAPTPGMFFYNAAKAGLAAASEALRAEVKPRGIHVVTVYPGPVVSAMEAAARAAYEDHVSSRHAPTGTAETLARLIAAAVTKKRARVIYPGVYGVSRHFPNATRWALDALTPPLRRS